MAVFSLDLQSFARSDEQYIFSMKVMCFITLLLNKTVDKGGRATFFFQELNAGRNNNLGWCLIYKPAFIKVVDWIK